jgi:hypothetical protein
MKLYAVFPFDDANIYRPEAAVSRPYKRKAAAEALAEKMTADPDCPVPRGYVVREYRGALQALSREQVLLRDNRALRQRTEQLEARMITLQATVTDCGVILDRLCPKPSVGCLQPIDPNEE